MDVMGIIVGGAIGCFLGNLTINWILFDFQRGILVGTLAFYLYFILSMIVYSLYRCYVMFICRRKNSIHRSRRNSNG